MEARSATSATGMRRFRRATEISCPSFFKVRFTGIGGPEYDDGMGTTLPSGCKGIAYLTPFSGEGQLMRNLESEMLLLSSLFVVLLRQSVHRPTTSCFSEMKIITYSDLHLEFGSGWRLPPQADGDVMVLAGDIITLRDYRPLDRLLQAWKKPVLYVTGNHEYYTRRPMDREDAMFREWLKANHPHVRLLLDEPASIDGVNFFGGTMWTDFKGGDPLYMETAAAQMNDFRLIYNPDETPFKPADAVALHDDFAAKLMAWFDTSLTGSRVVISHNAPVINPNTKFKESPLWPAFNSLDMLKVIEERQPELWIYGHTHECDDQKIGRTRIISNQLGYPGRFGGFECRDFDPAGIPVEVGT
jgi:predicted phosphodiesterase